MTTFNQDSGTTTHEDGRAGSRLVAAPNCHRCRTDVYLYVEDFTPARIGEDGALLRLGEASCFCTRCVQYAAHAVPPLRTPDSFAPAPRTVDPLTAGPPAHAAEDDSVPLP